MVRSGAAVRASTAIQGGLTSRVGVGTQPVDGGGGRSGQHVASVSPDVGTPPNEYPGYHAMAVAVLTGHGDTGRAVGLCAPSQYVLRARLGARSALAIAGGFHPDATANAVHADGLFRTGDIGRVDEDGH
jgi:acyl-CoA synthetase (AMP-forming)/AMP-acid ligase II